MRSKHDLSYSCTTALYDSIYLHIWKYCLLDLPSRFYFENETLSRWSQGTKSMYDALIVTFYLMKKHAVCVRVCKGNFLFLEYKTVSHVYIKRQRPCCYTALVWGFLCRHFVRLLKYFVRSPNSNSTRIKDLHENLLIVRVMWPSTLNIVNLFVYLLIYLFIHRTIFRQGRLDTRHASQSRSQSPRYPCPVLLSQQHPEHAQKQETILWLNKFMSCHTRPAMTRSLLRVWQRLTHKRGRARRFLDVTCSNSLALPDSRLSVSVKRKDIS